MSENISLQPKPTYFEIFTKVLNELNWREVSDFDEIIKSEHKRILNLINTTNAEVLSSYMWDFMIEKKDVTLEENEEVIDENFGGRVISIWEGRKKYRYIRPAVFSSETINRDNVYSFLSNKLMAAKSDKKRNLSIICTSNMYALDSLGNKKAKMEEKEDTSIIPMPHIEPVLVYGTLIKVKANPSFAKFGYWRTLYLEALANLRTASSMSCEDSPRITLG
ncbi:TPA: hypothetical protein IAA86_05470 [Candidatus Galligastranaerophilus intestinavium]|uniref:Uncharacterized protein n=1 Tax=Candidatus Galligastranaerophilus intestinavium TaxID=2840836 RepID=A0A9D1FIR1_9BACT|nr:hypothetical protein [Candidatus Galligastranaerophilus intestinavium]